MSDHLSRYYVSLSPLLVLCQALGLFPVRVERLRSKFVLNSNQSRLKLVMWAAIHSVETYAVVQIMRGPAFLDLIPKELVNVLIGLLLVERISATLTSYLRRSELVEVLRQVADLDFELDRVGVTPCHEQDRKSTVSNLLSLLVLNVLRSLLTAHYVEDISLVQSLLLFGGGINKSLIMCRVLTLLQTLDGRLDKLNTALSAGHTELGRVGRLHLGLVKCARAIVRVHGLEIVLSTMVSCYVIGFQCYALYISCTRTSCSAKPFLVFNPVLWFLEEMYELTKLVRVCCSTCQNANETSIILHRMRMERSLSKAQSREVYLLSVQFVHQKLSFTALGMFPLDYTLLFSVITAVASYLTIYVQSDLPQFLMDQRRTANKENTTDFA